MPAELAVNPFLLVNFCRLAAVAVVRLELIFSRHRSLEDWILVVKWQLLLAHTVKVNLLKVLVNLALDLLNFILKIHRIVRVNY